MNINFRYEKEKDLWCLMNYGKNSNNSSLPTKIWQEVIDIYGVNPSEEEVLEFIKNKNIKTEDYITLYQNTWDSIKDQYIKKAEEIFGISIFNNIDVFLSMNNRCPYNIEKNYFFISISNSSFKKTIMHELWHFYTWYKFGSEEEKLGKIKFNDLKESLTVLLNIEFPNLLDEDKDIGYPQHQELRKSILDFWKKDKDINKLWESLVSIK